MSVYASKSELGRFFSMSAPTVYSRIAGIEEQIKAGRYSDYAISDNRINKAVFLDYNKYWKMLADKNMRKYVPPFNVSEAYEYVLEKGGGQKC